MVDVDYDTDEVTGLNRFFTDYGAALGREFSAVGDTAAEILREHDGIE